MFFVLSKDSSLVAGDTWDNCISEPGIQESHKTACTKYKITYSVTCNSLYILYILNTSKYSNVQIHNKYIYVYKYIFEYLSMLRSVDLCKAFT